MVLAYLVLAYLVLVEVETDWEMLAHQVLELDFLQGHHQDHLDLAFLALA